MREKPETLLAPEAFNHCRSVDSAHDELGDAPSFRLLSLIDDFNGKTLAGISTPRSRPNGSWAYWTGSSNEVANRKPSAATPGPGYIQKQASAAGG